MSTAPLDLTSQVKKPSVLPDVIAQALAPQQGQGPSVGDMLKASIGSEEVKPEFNPGTPNPEPEVPSEDNPLGGFDAIQKLIGSPKGGGLEGSTPQPSLAPQPPPPKPQTSFGQKLAKVLPIIGMAGGALEGAGNGPFHPPVGAEMYQNALAQAGQRALKKQELEQVEVPKAQAYSDYMSGRNQTSQDVANTRAGASVTGANVRAGAQRDVANTRADASRDVATINANSRNQIAALQQGAPMHISEEDAALAGQPQLANQDINGKTLQNFIKILGSKGIKIQDLGGEGLWTVDRGGNRLRQVSVSSPSKYRADASMSIPAIKAANTPVDVYDENGNLTSISQKQQLESGVPSAGHVFAQQGPTNTTRTMSQMAQTIQPHLDTLKQEINELSPYLGPLMGRGEVNFAAGTVGSTGNPILDYKLGRLMSDFKLAASAVGRTHFAGRTGLPAAQYFGELLNAKRSPEELNGVLESIPSYIEGYSEMQNFKPKQAASAPARPGSPPPATPQKSAPPSGQPAPEGTVVTMPDGSTQVKKGGKWMRQ